MTKIVNLALQGGGAHGAFTWGALERLLDEDDIDVEAITATSAGAMNAAMMVTGLARGGREGAKDLLKTFWEEVIRRALGPVSCFSMFALPHTPLMMRAFYEYAPLYQVGKAVTGALSPYQFNPLNINPLRELLDELIDFDEVCSNRRIQLFVNATNVHRGRPRVFSGDEINVDTLLASACLPDLFQAIEIDGEPYWDGGFMGNPAIYPLIYGAECRDVLIVHINPIIREETPLTAPDIANRINEISFNASLMREMRAVHFVQTLIDNGIISEERWKRLRIHSIRDEETMRDFGITTKLAADWAVICELRNAGRAATDRWLAEHKNKIGVSDSVNIQAEFL